MLVLVALTLLHGMVRIGPITPVCRVDTPCDAPAAHVTLTFRRGTAAVRATTDSAGRYRVRLAPGTWTVRANRGMRTAPARFVVPRAPTATRNFSIDTGIR